MSDLDEGIQWALERANAPGPAAAMDAQAASRMHAVVRELDSRLKEAERRADQNEMMLDAVQHHRDTLLAEREGLRARVEAAEASMGKREVMVRLAERYLASRDVGVLHETMTDYRDARMAELEWYADEILRRSS